MYIRLKALKLIQVIFVVGIFFVLAGSYGIVHAVDCSNWNASDTALSISNHIATVSVPSFDGGSDGNWILSLQYAPSVGSNQILKSKTLPKWTGANKEFTLDYSALMKNAPSSRTFHVRLDADCPIAVVHKEQATDHGDISSSAEFDEERCAIVMKGLVPSGTEGGAVEHYINVDGDTQVTTSDTGVLVWDFGKVTEAIDVSVFVELRTGTNYNLIDQTVAVTPCEGSAGGAGELKENPSPACTIDGEPGIVTALGCIPTEQTGITNWVMKFAFFISGALVVFRIIQGSIMIMTAIGNPDKIQEGKAVITSAIVGLMVILGAVMLLQFIGVDFLGLNIAGLGQNDL